MTSADILTLPPEILRGVCSILYDSHKPSLAAFSLASKRCCDAASLRLFRHLTLHVRGSQSLKRCFDALLPALTRRNATLGIRRITISGSFRIYADDKEEPPDPGWELDDDNYYGDDEIYGPDSRHSVWTPPFSPTPDELAPHWAPLVSLIQEASNLQYLDYNLETSVPSNIVTALEQYSPGCRLHVEHFRYWELTKDTTVPREIDLVKSPNLHSLRVRYVYRTSIGQDDYNRLAVLRTIGGISPNLKQATMIGCRAPESAALRRRRNEPQPQWNGFDESVGPARRATLDSFTYHSGLTPTRVAGLPEVIDFATLSHLELCPGEITSTLPYLIGSVVLSCLRSLVLSLGPSMDTPQSRTLTAFLRHVPFLESLDLQGYVRSESIDAIFAHQGPLLRSLKLHGGEYKVAPFSFHDCERLRDSLPNLEELHITIWRSQSAGDEVACYRALSQCRNLQKLFIEMACDRPDASNASSLPPGVEWECSFGGGSREQTFWRFRDLMVNAAVDEPLARSVWDFMCHVKQGLPLISLKLCPVFLGGLHPTCRKLVSTMRRAYLVERPLRDDSDEPRIRELGERARKARLAQGFEHRLSNLEMTRDSPLTVFRWLWPEKREGSAGWWDDWLSFPLQLDRVEVKGQDEAGVEVEAQAGSV